MISLIEFRRLQLKRSFFFRRVNFTNVSRAAFTSADPKSEKKQSSHQCLFVLTRSAGAKAALKTLVKSTPNGVLKMLITQFNGLIKTYSTHFFASN